MAAALLELTGIMQFGLKLFPGSQAVIRLFAGG